MGENKPRTAKQGPSDWALGGGAREAHMIAKPEVVVRVFAAVVERHAQRVGVPGRAHNARTRKRRERAREATL